MTLASHHLVVCSEPIAEAVCCRDPCAGGDAPVWKRAADSDPCRDNRDYTWLVVSSWQHGASQPSRKACKVVLEAVGGAKGHGSTPLILELEPSKGEAKRRAGHTKTYASATVSRLSKERSRTG